MNRQLRLAGLVLALGLLLGRGVWQQHGHAAGKIGDDLKQVGNKLKQLFSPARASKAFSPVAATAPAMPLATITVTSLGDGAATTANCPGANCRLRDAIAKAVADDTINFSVTGTITLNSGELVIGKNLTINGPGAAQLTISGNQASRVFKISSGVAVALNGLTIANGRNEDIIDSGGGIHNQGALTLTNCTLSGNSDASGGGGINNESTLILTNCTLSGNSATKNGSTGGAIFSSGSLTITGCTLSNNSASNGGGIYNDGALTLTNSTLFGNSATSGGGIFCFDRSSATITNSTLSGNTAGGSGGGINIYLGGATLINSTLSGNSASASGGGIYDRGDYDAVNTRLFLYNCTITSNLAANGGGGIYVFGSVYSRNTIIAGNNATQSWPDTRIFGYFNTLGHNLFGVKNPEIVPTTGDQFGTLVSPLNPRLATLANNGGPTQTHRLLPGSPALNAGANCVLTNNCVSAFGWQPNIGFNLTTDQRGTGFNRQVGSAVDIGAVELQNDQPLLTVNPATLPAGALGNAYNQTLSATGGSGNYSFSLSSGVLAAGLTLAATGQISGTPTGGGSFLFTVAATDNSLFDVYGTRTYTLTIPSVCTTAPSGLVAWWRAEGSASDAMGANHGTLQGSATISTAAEGQVGRAFKFDGTNGYVALPDNLFPFPTAGTGTTPFSFELWFKTGSGGVILGQQNGAPYNTVAGNVPAIYVGTDGKLRVEMFWNGAVNPLVSAGTVNDNLVFHHLAVSYDGTQQIVYLDGQVMGSQAHTQTAYNAGYKYQLGAGVASGWPGGSAANGGWFNFNGLIDEPSLYNRALTAQEVQTLYGTGNAGKCASNTAPNMNVKGNNLTIANGDTTPSATDGADLGSAAANTGTVARSFTIENTGTGPLNLTGTPKVVLSGANAADFSIAVQPVSPIAATNGTTTFLVNFAPPATGTRTATVNIANDDSNHNPYTFTIQGTGTPPANGPACGNYANRTTANGLGSNFVRDVYAVGNTIYAATRDGLSISTDGGVSFTNRTTANGLGNNEVSGVHVSGSTIYAATTGGLSISTDGGVSFANRTTANGLGIGGVWDVYAVGSTVYAATGSGLSISTDGGASFTNRTTANGLPGNYVFGIYVEGSTVYAVTRNGVDGAGRLAVSTNGGMSFNDFGVPNGATSVLGVYAVGSTVYAATDGGLAISTNGGMSFFIRRTTANGLGSNRVNDVYVLGSTVYAATGGAAGVENGGLSISTDGGASFTNQTPSFNGLGHSLVIGVYATSTSVYAATADGLSLCPSFSSAPVITPLNTVSRQQGSPASIPFSPIAAVRDNETPLGNLVVTATTVPAGISVSSITNNAGLISATFGADCTAAVGNHTVVFTVTDGNGETGTCSVIFNVRANDAPTLSYGSVVVNSGGAVTKSPTTATDNGSITSYAVQSQGSYTGTISVNATGVISISGAAPLGNHTITIRGTDNCGVSTVASFTLSVLEQIVSVNGNNQPIANGDTTPSVTDGTDFGSAAANLYAVAHYFTITNSGATALNLTGNPRVVLSGPNAADFSIALQPVSPVAAINGVTTFLVNFAPTATGTRMATVSIANDAPSFNPYTFTIQGTGTPAPANGPACGSFTNRTTANGLGDNRVNGVYAVDSTIYAATGNGTTGGLAISTDGGASFTNRTTANGLGSNFVDGVYAAGSTVYAATVSGLSISTDGGVSFTNRTTANGLGGDRVISVYAAGNTIYAATDRGLAISTNGGASFTNRTNANGLGDNRVNGVYAVGSTVYAATISGLSISTNGGSSFPLRTTGNGLGSNFLHGVYVQGNTVYAATFGGLSISTNGGASFTNRTTANGLGSNNVRSVYVLGSTVYAATSGGLSISTDGGASFTNYTTANGVGSNFVSGVYATNGAVYAATSGGLSSCLPPNTNPTITPAATLTRQQSSPAGAAVTIATVNDVETAAGSLTVAATTVPAGISVTGITNNNGTISATVAAACNATLGNNTIVLTVTDGGGATTTGNLIVNVTANAAPTVGSYPNTLIAPGGSTIVTPSAAPADNASIASVTATATPNFFTGALTANTATGALTITNANPVGGYNITVTVTDNCGATTTRTFMLTVNACGASLSKPAQNFAANGGTGTFTVTIDGACPWTAVSNAPSFITIVAPQGQMAGPGTVSFTVGSHTNSTPRSGTITVAGQTFLVRQGAQFGDVPVGATFYEEIGKLSAVGVTQGCGGGNYCPTSNVTREQMAAFLSRALGVFNPPTPGSQRFADVPPSNPFYAFVEELALRQITLGCGGGNYCPAANVTREQMAAFIIRALHNPGYVPPLPGAQRFLDVPPSNPFYAHIEELAARAITLGCGGGNYCPAAFVTRVQMAAFLVRAFGL